MITEKSKDNPVLYKKDELGRQVKLELEDEKYNILKLELFNIEETFLDFQTKKKVTFDTLFKKYLIKTGLKLISKLNNKIIIQLDDDFKIFTFKSVHDSGRFMDFMSVYFLKFDIKDCLLVKDTSTTQRKFLYKKLDEVGFSKSYLFRSSTTHLK